jgi:hypothetical protein
VTTERTRIGRNSHTHDRSLNKIEQEKSAAG